MGEIYDIIGKYDKHLICIVRAEKNEGKNIGEKYHFDRGTGWKKKIYVFLFVLYKPMSPAGVNSFGIGDKKRVIDNQLK